MRISISISPFQISQFSKSINFNLPTLSSLCSNIIRITGNKSYFIQSGWCGSNVKMENKNDVQKSAATVNHSALECDLVCDLSNYIDDFQFYRLTSTKQVMDFEGEWINNSNIFLTSESISIRFERTSRFMINNIMLIVGDSFY